MDIVDLFTKVLFPSALSILLLYAIGKGIKTGWEYLVKREQDLIARLDAAHKKAEEDREKFLNALAAQMNNSKESSKEIVAAICDLVDPIKESTGTTLANMNILIELVKAGNLERKKR